jgi:hypothetical protein
MASSGKEAWKKHFKGTGKMEVVLKRATTLEPDGKHKSISLDVGETVLHEQIDTEKEYLSYASNPKAANPSAKLPVVYGGKRYLCPIDSFGKPSKTTGRIDLALQTSKLLANSRTESLSIFGEQGVPCAVFTNARDLAKICKDYVETNKLLEKQNINLKKSLLKYFSSNRFDSIEWIGAISDAEIAEFAKYIGEVAIGLCLLTGKENVLKGNNPVRGRTVDRVIFPKSESFGGVDSVIEYKQGRERILLPISSKAAVGAKPSFWTNIFPSVVENSRYRPKGSVLKKIYDSAETIGSDGKNAKEIVYEYGIRNVLKLKSSVIKNTYQVFEEFRKYPGPTPTKYTPEVRTVFNALKDKMKSVGDKTAVERLDESTTVFFCKAIAEELNADKNSQDLMLEILGQKQFMQLNMQIPPLKRGSLEFNVVLVPGSVKSITMTGTKSAYTDITAKQGTVNYMLK